LLHLGASQSKSASVKAQARPFGVFSDLQPWLLAAGILHTRAPAFLADREPAIESRPRPHPEFFFFFFIFFFFFFFFFFFSFDIAQQPSPVKTELFADRSGSTVATTAGWGPNARFGGGHWIPAKAQFHTGSDGSGGLQFWRSGRFLATQISRTTPKAKPVSRRTTRCLWLRKRSKTRRSPARTPPPGRRDPHQHGTGPEEPQISGKSPSSSPARQG